MKHGIIIRWFQAGAERARFLIRLNLMQKVKGSQARNRRSRMTEVAIVVGKILITAYVGRRSEKDTGGLEKEEHALPLGSGYKL